MSSAFSQVLSLIIPPVCLSCQVSLEVGEAESFCPECRKEIFNCSDSICRCCGDSLDNPSLENTLCGDCLKNPPAFEWARSILQLTPALSKLIHNFKYSGEEAALPWMVLQMQNFLAEKFPDLYFDFILPVPLHWWRLLRRGYNQSLLLAKLLAKTRGEILCRDNLQKTKASKAQSTLSKEKRLKQLKGAFRLKHVEKFKNKKVLLIDDIYTTGSTLQECARVLNDAGAKVYAFTLARTPLKF